MNLFKIVPWFIGFTFILIIAIWIVAGLTIYKGIEAVSEVGLKSIAEHVWCGKDADCKLLESK